MAPAATIEQSHGKARLTRPRPSDLNDEPPATDCPRDRDRDTKGRFQTGNQCARNRRTKTTLTATLQRVASTLKTGEPELHAEVARDILALFGEELREQPDDSPAVRTHLMTYARESRLAMYYTNEASKVGLGTPEGMRFIELAHKCENRAERASTLVEAMAMARAKRKGRDRPIDVRERLAREAAALRRDEP